MNHNMENEVIVYDVYYYLDYIFRRPDQRSRFPILLLCILEEDRKIYHWEVVDKFGQYAYQI